MTKKTPDLSETAAQKEFYGSELNIKAQNSEGGIKLKDLYKLAKRRYKWIFISGGITFTLIL